jgi:hypothetical protein
LAALKIYEFAAFSDKDLNRALNELQKALNA